ncbi:MAG: hypothetical protein DRI97_15225 [Bacteroidetes bacterium]|nr:MAG: hypothetical protein DRI97_15225 [Bacteroidota bacterium]
MVYKRRSVEINLFYGAKPAIFEKARALRAHMTESEKILWDALRRKGLAGYRFRRQHPIDKFIVDFYCHEAKLVIEIDGEIHKYQDKDYELGRTAEIEKFGITVIRFSNHHVLLELDTVLTQISSYLKV